MHFDNTIEKDSAPK
jgi:hypothetical protein